MVKIFGRNQPLPAEAPAPKLTTLVAQTADVLRGKETHNNVAADTYLSQAAFARDTAAKAGVQAEATEKALAILEEAGVTL